MEPWATLAVFRSPGVTDGTHVGMLLGASRSHATAHGWMISSAGCVASHSVRAHVSWLMAAVAGKEASIAQLRSEGYWVCVRFHYFCHNEAPDPAVVQAISDELETSDISFDLELERDDFPPWSS